MNCFDIFFKKFLGDKSDRSSFNRSLLIDVSEKTEDLFAESLKYEKKAKHLNLMLLWRKYGVYKYAYRVIRLL